MTTTPTLIDMHALVRDWLKADTGLTVPVYARRIPAKQAPPAIIVKVMGTELLSRPASMWWVYMLQIEALTTDHRLSGNLIAYVQARMVDLPGVHAQGVVTDCRPWGVAVLEDEDYTPPAPNHVLTADITARPLKESEIPT